LQFFLQLRPEYIIHEIRGLLRLAPFLGLPPKEFHFVATRQRYATPFLGISVVM
jgi:hypothetical protein